MPTTEGVPYILKVLDSGCVIGADTLTELAAGTSVPITKEFPGVPVGPGVRTRLPPTYVATKSLVSALSLSLNPAPMWSAAFATAAFVSKAYLLLSIIKV